MLAGNSCHIQHSKLLKLVSVTEWVGLSRTLSLGPHIIISDEHLNQKYWPKTNILMLRKRRPLWDSYKDRVICLVILRSLKPLSHQGGVLTVIPRCPKNCRTPRCAQYERKHHRSNAVASPLDTVGRKERRATVRTLSILKTNTDTRRSLGVLKERRGDAVRSP